MRTNVELYALINSAEALRVDASIKLGEISLMLEKLRDFIQSEDREVVGENVPLLYFETKNSGSDDLPF